MHTGLLLVTDVIFGSALTVKVVVIWQPVAKAKVIMLLPTLNPLMAPTLLTGMVACPLLLLQVPVPTSSASVKVVVPDRQTAGVPDMLAGKGFTVTVTAAEAPQPVV